MFICVYARLFFLLCLLIVLFLTHKSWVNYFNQFISSWWSACTKCTHLHRKEWKRAGEETRREQKTSIYTIEISDFSLSRFFDFFLSPSPPLPLSPHHFFYLTSLIILCAFYLSLAFFHIAYVVVLLFTLDSFWQSFCVFVYNIGMNILYEIYFGVDHIMSLAITLKRIIWNIDCRMCVSTIYTAYMQNFINISICAHRHHRTHMHIYLHAIGEWHENEI